MTAKTVSNEPMSKDKEEEMSSALIAQLLAEDAMAQGNGGYYAEYSNDNRGYDPYHSHRDQDDSYEENSEDDFEPKKKAGVKKGKKRKAPVPSNTKPSVKKEKKTTPPVKDESIIKDKQPETTTKKPRKAVPEGCNTGVYNDLEEKNFIEGLELFGREWGKIQSHVGTRDSNSIRSHAQKHFIKMYRDNIPLPAKVRESGEGYTLSGKPLDPNSSAAKPYLNRNSIIKKPKEDVIKVAPVNNIEEKQMEKLTIKEEEDEKPATLSPSTSTGTHSSDTTPYDSQGRTSYSTKRLRKQRDPSSMNYGQINKDDDPLTLIKCEPFVGKPGSNTTGSQPFEMTVESNVLLAMDFHAHLMTTEIIGFLAGDWDKENKRIIVREAFPCRSIETGQNDVNVEMDPTSAIETRQLIEERHMQVVGWYHSHPTFIPDPSLIDIENQRNYQTLCRESHDHSIEPFVGAIIGPYDPALPASSSVINWFYVNNTPKRLIYDLKENDSITKDETDRLFHLLLVYKNSPEKVNFAEFWRQDATETKLQKMIKSLGSRMPWVQKQLKENNELQDLLLEKIQLDLKDW